MITILISVRRDQRMKQTDFFIMMILMISLLRLDSAGRLWIKGLQSWAAARQIPHGVWWTDRADEVNEVMNWWIWILAGDEEVVSRAKQHQESTKAEKEKAYLKRQLLYVTMLLVRCDQVKEFMNCEKDQNKRDEKENYRREHAKKMVFLSEVSQSFISKLITPLSLFYRSSIR